MNNLYWIYYIRRYCRMRAPYRFSVGCAASHFQPCADETQFYHPGGSPVRIAKNMIFHICAAGHHAHIHTYVHMCGSVDALAHIQPSTAVAAGFFGLTQLRRGKLHSPQKKIYGSGCNHTWN
jgi:hypothetical protein